MMAGRGVAKTKFKPGDVIWASTSDRSGIEKSRPLLVIAPPTTSDAQPVCCLGISTRPSQDAGDPTVEMPWSSSGGSTTGLYEWCAVVLLWHVLVDQKDITKKLGVVSDVFLDDVMTRREAALMFRANRGKP
jgi:hypothetical protein